jgi:rhodanese-related sulfurtransferase
MQHSPGFLALVASVLPGVRTCSVDDVRAMQQRGARFHLVDVREDHEWNAGRIAGAVHLGKGIIERDVEQRIPDHDATIVLYCGGGYRSALAADALGRMGYRDVRSMDGGWKAWTAAGGATEG